MQLLIWLQINLFDSRISYKTCTHETSTSFNSTRMAESENETKEKEEKNVVYKLSV